MLLAENVSPKSFFMVTNYIGCTVDANVTPPPTLQVCPICASVPGGDPNHVTDDFNAHITFDHRGGGAAAQPPRELISFTATRAQQACGEGGGVMLTLVQLFLADSEMSNQRGLSRPRRTYARSLLNSASGTSY